MRSLSGMRDLGWGLALCLSASYLETGLIDLSRAFSGQEL